ncbi:MAG: hypothetical protein K2M48_04615, partial [Clostridiales bacterium]|nr:hypothetical protein [Clostridiales bacterium]
MGFKFIMKDYKLKIYEAARAVLPELEKSDVAPADMFCDYCVPCFKLAKIYRKSPAAIAQEAAAKLKIDGMTVEALNGYLNFTIAREAVIADVFSSAPGEYKPLKGKTVCLDYSSVNIAKPFH